VDDKKTKQDQGRPEQQNESGIVPAKRRRELFNRLMARPFEHDITISPDHNNMMELSIGCFKVYFPCDAAGIAKLLRLLRFYMEHPEAAEIIYSGDTNTDSIDSMDPERIQGFFYYQALADVAAMKED